jgi:hypothetical protein
MSEESFKLTNLRRRVNRLKDKQKQKEENKRKLELSIQEIKDCLVYLEGILSTHRALDIPAHTSEESLFFFKDRKNQTCLIKELNPSPEFMPEMRRISVTQAKTGKMKCGDRGFVIQRVLFSYPNSTHEQMLFCPSCCVVEKI